MEMASVTVFIQDKLKREMDAAGSVDWSIVASEAFDERVRQLKLVREVAEKSRLTMDDAVDIGRRIKRGLRKRYEKSSGEA